MDAYNDKLELVGDTHPASVADAKALLAQVNIKEEPVSVDMAAIEGAEAVSRSQRRLNALLNVYNVTASDSGVEHRELLREIFREVDAVNPDRFLKADKFQEGA